MTQHIDFTGEAHTLEEVAHAFVTLYHSCPDQLEVSVTLQQAREIARIWHDDDIAAFTAEHLQTVLAAVDMAFPRDAHNRPVYQLALGCDPGRQPHVWVAAFDMTILGDTAGDGGALFRGIGRGEAQYYYEPGRIAIYWHRPGGYHHLLTDPYAGLGED